MGFAICHIYSLKEYIKLRIFIQEETGEVLAIHRQTLDLHDLKGVGGGTGSGAQEIIEGQFSPDQFVAEVHVARLRVVFGQLCQLKIVRGDHSTPAAPNKAFKYAWLPIRCSRLLVPRKISFTR